MFPMCSDWTWSLNACLQQCSSDMGFADMAAKVPRRSRVVARQLWVVCLFVALFGCISPALRAATDSTSQKQSLTLEQYDSELDRLSSAVSGLVDHPDGTKPLRESLPSGWIVTAKGEQFEISSEWLASSLKDMEENLSERKKRCEALAGQLQKLRSEAERLSGTAQSADITNARVKLNHILSGREFQTVKGESWLGRVWDQVSRWIEWILDHTIGRLLAKGPMRTLVFWVVVIGVFLLIAFRVFRILARLARTEALRVDGAFPPGKNWREWAQEALATARGGDYRSALHSAYWAGIYRLADSGAWRLDEARTPREYLRLFKNPPRREAGLSVSQPAAEPGRVTALAALTRSMESAWYGYTPATEQDFESAIDNLETLGCKLRSTAQTANS
jgi:hypothetical protein